jgi:hypothetical protein
MRPKYDVLWKGLMEELMADLLLFVEPAIGRELDLGRGFEFLDKELTEMYPEPEKPSNTRVVDKLVKVFLRTLDVVAYRSAGKQRKGFCPPDV